MFRDRIGFHPGINHYVPGMQFASGLSYGGDNVFSLGTPAAEDADIVANDTAANATAGTEVAISWTADSTYGRTLRLTISGDPGAASSVVDIYGKDYLGQPMVERFTVANGSTAVQYGKKAFYTVTKSKIVTASTNAVTFDLGTGFRLGLPYKGDVVAAKENNIYVPLYNRPVVEWFDMSDADVTAGASLIHRVEFPGYVSKLYGVAGSGGSTTNAATTVEIETVAVTGLTVTIDQDTQTMVSDDPTVDDYTAVTRFRPGNRLEIVHAATTAGGTNSFGLELTPTQWVAPDLTDAATVSTGDPRGTYEPITTLDDTLEIVVIMRPDGSVNSSNNGGLHGIRHYHP